jgi:hypothetical protein
MFVLYLTYVNLLCCFLLRSQLSRSTRSHTVLLGAVHEEIRLYFVVEPNECIAPVSASRKDLFFTREFVCLEKGQACGA